MPSLSRWAMEQMSLVPTDAAAVKRMQSEPLGASDVYPPTYLKASYEGLREGISGYYRDVWLLHSKLANVHPRPRATADPTKPPPAPAPLPGAASFEIANIPPSLPVYIVHGEHDSVVPVCYARYHCHQLSIRGGPSNAATAAAATHCQLKPAAGHFSVIHDSWSDLLKDLTSHHSK